jgi:hypothetical protein
VSGDDALGGARFEQGSWQSIHKPAHSLRWMAALSMQNVLRAFAAAGVKL